MTTELIEPKAPLQVGVIRKQYAKGMTLPQLARLHETDVKTLKPLVKGVEQKRRATSDEEDESDMVTAGDAKAGREKSSRYHIDHAAYADRVKRMMAAGMSNAEMMAELDITHTNLQTVKKKFGLKLTYADGGPRRVARQKRVNQTKEETS